MQDTLAVFKRVESLAKRGDTEGKLSPKCLILGLREVPRERLKGGMRNILHLVELREGFGAARHGDKVRGGA